MKSFRTLWNYVTRFRFINSSRSRPWNQKGKVIGKDKVAKERRLTTLAEVRPVSMQLTHLWRKQPFWIEKVSPTLLWRIGIKHNEQPREALTRARTYGPSLNNYLEYPEKFKKPLKASGPSIWIKSCRRREWNQSRYHHLKTPKQSNPATVLNPTPNYNN